MTTYELRNQAELDGALPGNRTEYLLWAADEIDRLAKRVEELEMSINLCSGPCRLPEERDTLEAR